MHVHAYAGIQWLRGLCLEGGTQQVVIGEHTCIHRSLLCQRTHIIMLSRTLWHTYTHIKSVFWGNKRKKIDTLWNWNPISLCFQADTEIPCLYLVNKLILVHQIRSWVYRHHASSGSSRYCTILWAQETFNYLDSPVAWSVSAMCEFIQNTYVNIFKWSRSWFGCEFVYVCLYHI